MPSSQAIDLNKPAENPDHYTQHKTWIKFKKRQKHFDDRPLWQRTSIVAAGVVLLIIGIAIGPLPGPGPVIIIPLAISLLALRFSFAEKLLAWTLQKYIKAEQRTRAASPAQRIAMSVGGFVLFVGAIAFGILVVAPML